MRRVNRIAAGAGEELLDRSSDIPLELIPEDGLEGLRRSGRTVGSLGENVHGG